MKTINDLKGDDNLEVGVFKEVLDDEQDKNVLEQIVAKAQTKLQKIKEDERQKRIEEQGRIEREKYRKIQEEADKSMLYEVQTYIDELGDLLNDKEFVTGLLALAVHYQFNTAFLFGNAWQKVQKYIDTYKRMGGIK